MIISVVCKLYEVVEFHTGNRVSLPFKSGGQPGAHEVWVQVDLDRYEMKEEAGFGQVIRPIYPEGPAEHAHRRRVESGAETADYATRQQQIKRMKERAQSLKKE